MSPRLVLAVVVAIVGAACSSLPGSGNEDLPADGDEADAQPAMEPLDCEELGFPCSWADTTRQARERTGELLAQAGLALGDGQDPFDVAAALEDEDGVVAVLADQTGVQVRVEGAPPVVAWSPLTHPLASAMAFAGNRSELGADHPANIDVLSTGVGAVGAGGTLVAAGTVLPYEPPRDPDVRPRSALLVRPWEAYDASMVRGQLSPDQLPQDFVPDARILDEFAIGRTVRVLERSPYVDLVRATSDAAFSQFDAHDLVVIQTHGATFDSSKNCHPERGHVCGQVLGGYPLGIHDPADTTSEFLEVAFRDLERLPAGATIGYMVNHWAVGYTPDFFRQEYAGGALDAIVIINACNSAATEDGESVLQGLSSTAGDTAGPAVFGWTDFIDAVIADVTTAVLTDLLVNQGVSAEMAMAAIDQVPELREHLLPGDPEDDEPRLVHAGRDLRARDVVTAQDDGTEMEPGAVLLVEGTPEDGTNDRIKELVLRIDGVPDDQHDDIELTWQFPARQPAPVEVENPLRSGEGLRVREVPREDDGPTLWPVTWKSYELTFTDLDLEFDVTREELQRQFGHELVVEVRAGDGEPSRHSIEPVHLRQGLVEVLDPEFGQPLEVDERVVIDGAVADGQPESFPLVVSLDQMDDELVPQLVLEVDIGGATLSVPGTQWQQVEEGRYRVDRPMELFDVPQDEYEVPVRAWVDVPELGTVEFDADPVVLVLGAGGCARLLPMNVSAEMGRNFAGPVDLGAESFFFEGICRYEAERSFVDISLVDGPDEVTALRARVDGGNDTAVSGFGDAATYDLTSGNALNPSSIEVDGEPQYSNFVNLVVALDDGTLATIHVQGNIVIEEGPESGLLTRLRGLVEALRAIT